MTRRLLVAGSNSGCQLGVGHDQDVRTFQEALCRLDTGSADGEQEITSFPPEGYNVIEISSGANHTLALVEHLKDDDDDDGSFKFVPKEVWVCGTGAQGQLGPEHASPENKPLDVFTRLDLEACLKGFASPPWSDNVLGTVFEPEKVSCGWNCSYIVFARRVEGNGEEWGPDILISLGLHRDNTFGELGCKVDSEAIHGSPSVHLVSFAALLSDLGLDTKMAIRIFDVAAGLRHAVAAVFIPPDVNDIPRMIASGWGSGRQGQVGRVPEAPTRRSARLKRPGPTAAVVSEPQLISEREITQPIATGCAVKAGRDHTVVLQHAHDDLRIMDLLCIGSNKQGQIIDKCALPTHATIPDDIADVTCNWNSTHTLLKPKGEPPAPARILSCGSNARGQLGNGSRASTTADDPFTYVDLSAVLQQQPTSSEQKVTVEKLVSGSEHSMLLVSRQSTTATATDEGSHVSSKPHNQVWGWGWNEHGNLAQGEHDEADCDRPVLLLDDGTRSGAALPSYTPLNVWAGCGTTFILADRHDS